MKKTKKAKPTRPGGAAKSRLKKATKLGEKDLKKVSGGADRGGTNDDSI